LRARPYTNTLLGRLDTRKAFRSQAMCRRLLREKRYDQLQQPQSWDAQHKTPILIHAISPVNQNPFTTPNFDNLNHFAIMRSIEQ
jgi:hypothetical protein